MADLSAASVDDVAAFFKMYYAPNNAVVGDRRRRGHQDGAREDARSTSARFPQQPAPPDVDMTEPPQTEERRLTLEDALARLPRIDMAYKIPPSSSPDDDALTVLGTILSGGRSSRFYESIVRQKQLATRRRRRLRTTARPRPVQHLRRPYCPGKTLPDSRPRSTRRSSSVKTGPIADWEIEKARAGARRGFVNEPRQLAAAAPSCSRRTRCSTTIRTASTRAPTAIAKVTRGRRAARRADSICVKTGRTVVLTVPKAAARRREAVQ